MVVDVKISEDLDALFMTPREPKKGTDLVRILRDVIPGKVVLGRSAFGVRVSASHAYYVFSEKTGIDFRFTEEIDRFVTNRNRAAKVYPRLLKELRDIKSEDLEVATARIEDSSGLDVLDAHQVMNVAAMTMTEGFGLCVFDEQGAGKTVTFIFAFDLLYARDLVDIAFVIAPKSMVPEWPRDFSRFRGDLYKIAVVAGSAHHKRDELNSGADVFITNFETAVSMEAEITAMLRNTDGRSVLAIDESFFIKSLDAKRTRSTRRLREWCDRAFVLCGTPAPNAPQDLIQQFNIVDFGLTFDNVDIPENRIEAAPVVQSTIEEKGLFVRSIKADVMPDLPSKNFNRMYVIMEPIQRRIYENALDDLVLDLESVSEEEFKRQYTTFLARRAALLQICSNPAAVTNGYQETPAKLLALDSLLHELIEQQREKVVLWSFYTYSISAMVKRYGHFGALRYDGKTPDVDMRRNTVQRFQESDDAMLLVANPAAAGAGLTLHRARYAIYESFSNQAAHYLQSLDRIHRRGQTREVEYIVLLCDETLELEEYERLISKEAAAQELLGDQFTTPLTRESLLADVRSAALLLDRPINQKEKEFCT